MSTDEIISSISQSLSLGDFTLQSILRVILILVVGVGVIRVLMKIIDRMLEQSKSLVTLKTYIYSVAKVILWFLLFLILADSLGIPITSLVALLSVAGLAVSLALQNTLSNLAGGIMVLVTKPFQVGDYVEADGINGTVSAIDLSYTTIVTPDNKEIFVPNSQISATKIINYNALGRRRVDLYFTASYDAPTQTVKQAIREVLDAIPQIEDDPAPVIYLSDYQASSIRYVVRAWVSAAEYWNVYYAIQEGVRESFDRHHVEMTYDHLNVHLVEK